MLGQGFDYNAFKNADKTGRKKMLEHKNKKDLQKICKQLGINCQGHALEILSKLITARL